jgi:hypothetical protein
MATAKTPKSPRQATTKAPKSAGRAKASSPARKPARAKPRTLQIGITPPEMAPRTAALKTWRALSSDKTRPSMLEIAKLPWLAQDRAYRVGYYLLTRGLSEHAAHPELEMCNVPGAFLEAAGDLLLGIGNAILEGSLHLADGEVMLVEESPLSVIGVRSIAPGKEGTVHDAPVLRIVFLA